MQISDLLGDDICDTYNPDINIGYVALDVNENHAILYSWWHWHQLANTSGPFY